MTQEQIQAMYQAVEDAEVDAKFQELFEKVDKKIKGKFSGREIDDICSLLCSINHNAFFVGANMALAFQKIGGGY